MSVFYEVLMEKRAQQQDADDERSRNNMRMGAGVAAKGIGGTMLYQGNRMAREANAGSATLSKAEEFLAGGGKVTDDALSAARARGVSDFIIEGARSGDVEAQSMLRDALKANIGGLGEDADYAKGLKAARSELRSQSLKGNALRGLGLGGVALGSKLLYDRYRSQQQDK